MTIGAQIRAARALKNMKVAELAIMAEVAPNTVVRVEADKNVNASSLKAIRQALEGVGVIFIDENGEGPGVRLKKSP